MAASLSALYDDAFAALERAIALDRLEKEEKGQTRAEDRTVLQYEAAIDLFQQCYDRESDVSRKILVESKMREYGKRLATLKATVADRRWTEAKALDAGRSKAATDDQDEAVAGAYLEAVELYLGSMKLQCNDEVQDVALRVCVHASWLFEGEGDFNLCARLEEVLIEIALMREVTLLDIIVDNLALTDYYLLYSPPFYQGPCQFYPGSR